MILSILHFIPDADLIAIYRRSMKKATRRTIVEKRRRLPRQSLALRQTFLMFESVLRSVDICLSRKPKMRLTVQKKVKKKNPRRQLHRPKKLPLLKRKLLRRRLHRRSVLRKRYLPFSIFHFNLHA